MAMAGMAGTAVGVAIAVLREKADRRSIRREAERELEESDPVTSEEHDTTPLADQPDDETKPRGEGGASPPA